MTCGGTGGHINPAIAIANIIKNNQPGSEIVFVGTKHGKERELVPREGYEIRFVESQGIRRSLSPANIKALFLAVISPLKARKIIREFHPDVVIGTGGYACWPLLKAAADLGVPCAVHESNAVPGMAVKRLQGYVDEIMTNFEKTKDYLKKKNKVVRVGNPLRSAFGCMEKSSARKKLGIPAETPFVLSYGGSGGAEFLNETMVLMMKEYAMLHPDVRILHAAGSRDFEKTKARFHALSLDSCPNLELKDYIYDMPAYMAAADLVICRAGAMTISELAMMGKASILIPSPNVVDNHQYKNAKVLADAGATCLLEESELTAEKLWEKIGQILGDGAVRRDMEQAVKKFADPDAGKRVYGEILKLVQKAD